MAEKLSMQASGCTDLSPLRETDEVSGKVVTEKSLSYMVMVPEKATHCHCCS